MWYDTGLECRWLLLYEVLLSLFPHECVQVPDARGAIIRRRDQEVKDGVEVDVVHRGSVPQEDRQASTGFQLPYAHLENCFSLM